MRAIRFPSVSLGAEAEQLRAEVRAFLQAEVASGTFVPLVDSVPSGFSSAFSRKVGERGWIGMTWPRRYGGQERTSLERFVVTEELLVAGAPVSAHWISDRQAGPLILRYGTEEQRQRYLPPITRGESFFAIGMSEPEAGSDLAAIQTTARRDGNGWILNGRKIWTSRAHRAHYLTLLCRTSPAQDDRHLGMSQFVVDLSSPGITVHPILLLSGEHHFNEVVFDDVFLPANTLVGEEGNGWQQVRAELAFERSGPERILSTFLLLVEFARALGTDPDDAAATALGRLVAHLSALRQMTLGVASILQSGNPPDIEAALVKDLGARFQREVAEVVRAILPCEPSLTANSQLDVFLAQALLHAPEFGIAGGTTEILRGIVARGLGVR